MLTAHVLRRLGTGLTLAALPALAMLGFGLLGSYPALAVLVGLRVLYDASRHALAKPAREVLFTLVGREERYKSKAFIDAAVYRGGDLVSGWLYAGLAGLGLSVAAIAWVAGPWAAVSRVEEKLDQKKPRVLQKKLSYRKFTEFVKDQKCQKNSQSEKLSLRSISP